MKIPSQSIWNDSRQVVLPVRRLALLRREEWEGILKEGVFQYIPFLSLSYTFLLLATKMLSLGEHTSLPRSPALTLKPPSN